MDKKKKKYNRSQWEPEQTFVKISYVLQKKEMHSGLEQDAVNDEFSPLPPK